VKEHLGEVQAQAEHWRPEEVLRWAYANFEDDIAMASGFGAEGLVLMDIAWRVHGNFRVFTLDTEFLFPETYDLIDCIENRYGIKIERVFSSLTPEEQEQMHGQALWARDPDLCCNLRKVEPLRNKLKDLRAWVTAIRRDQTTARGSAQKIEWDTKFQLVKVNPIADWTSEMVWSYIRKHKVPYNPLHDRSYPSIGCTHCTRPTQAGEDARAGRWSGFNKTECGLHVPEPQVPARVRIEYRVPWEEN
jgi:phosphoadenosine phosphosulfate reductase